MNMLRKALLVSAAAAMLLPMGNAWATDSLYIGDVSDNTVKRFNAATGAYLGDFVKQSSAGLHGPRGIVFDSHGNLIVSDQNAGTSTAGDILQYDATGKLLNRLVSHSDPNAPATPRGIVLRDDFLFVAEFTAELRQNNKPVIPGRLLKYTKTGEFIAASTPPAGIEFHPRGVVFGPDGLLYVSNVPNLPVPDGTGLGGHVLRFTEAGTFVDVFISNTGGAGELNRPEGLVFGPDGNLYITSFRANAGDTDSIRIYSPTGAFLSKIDLDAVGGPRAYAQALLFGPNGCLFVPVSNTGEVRRYDVGGSCDASSPYETFISAGGALSAPWYLTFGNTDPATLEIIP